MKLTNADYCKAEVNMDIFKLVKPWSNVIDVGCADGKLGKMLIEQKACEVVGIDKSNGIDVSLLPPLKGKFDCIIFADVLEHLPNPDEVLVWAKQYLYSDGCILISVPNVANWEVRLKALFGRFEYDGGLIDWGHLRFFTLRTIKKIVEDAGYKITFIGTRNRHIGLLAKVWKTLFAFQFIIEARLQ